MAGDSADTCTMSQASRDSISSHVPADDKVWLLGANPQLALRKLVGLKRGVVLRPKRFPISYRQSESSARDELS